MRIPPLPSYFTTEELQCRCGCGFGAKVEDFHPPLLEALHLIRAQYGKPMSVTSGARCAEHNRKEGGKDNSAHLPHPDTQQCRAVDIGIQSSMMRYTLIELALKVGIQRLGIADTFLHIDTAVDLPTSVIWTYSRSIPI